MSIFRYNGSQNLIVSYLLRYSSSGSISQIYSASNANKYFIPQLVEASISKSDNCKVFTVHPSTCFLTCLFCWFGRHSRLDILDMLIVYYMTLGLLFDSRFYGWKIRFLFPKCRLNRGI